jgi:hypothetical protein
MDKLIKKVDVKRVGDNGETSLGVIYNDGIAFCGSVEDREQKGDKVRGETRVSNGIYKLGLRKAGRHYEKYVARWGKEWFRGTPCVYTRINGHEWILDCPDGKMFKYIMVHLGNTDDHTEGCLLPNYVLDFLNDRGNRSGDAFKDIYPIWRDSIEASDKVDEWGNKYIDIEYHDVEDGK